MKKRSENEFPDLFHMNGFSWTDIDTGLAVNAHVLIHFGLIIFHGDCRCRTFAHAGFASGTLIEIYDCYQLVHSIVYILQKTKNRFRLYSRYCLSNKWLFFEIEHIAHAIDTGFFIHNPPGCMESPACKDGSIGRMVRELYCLEIL
jgi:hypothetical protein